MDTRRSMERDMGPSLLVSQDRMTDSDFARATSIHPHAPVCSVIAPERALTDRDVTETMAWACSSTSSTTAGRPSRCCARRLTGAGAPHAHRTGWPPVGAWACVHRDLLPVFS